MLLRYLPTNISILFVLMLVPSYLCAEVAKKSDQNHSDVPIVPFDPLKQADQLIAQGSLQEAQELLISYARQNPKNAIVAAKVCDLMIIQKNFKTAYVISTRLVQQFPDYDWPILLNFRAAIELRDFETAARNIELLSQIKTKANLDLLKGEYERARNKPAKAESFYKAALSAEPENSEIKKLRAWNLKNLAVRFKNKGEMKQAIKSLNRVVSFSDDVEAKQASLMIADIYLEEQRVVEADKALSRIPAELRTDDVIEKMIHTRLLLASDFYKKKRFKQALKWLDTAREIKESYAEVLMRGNIFRERGNCEAAEAEYLRALQMNDRDPYLYEAMAWNYTLWNKLLEAENAIKKAIVLAPKDPRFYVVYANQLRNRRKLSLGLVQLSKAKKICEQNKNCERFDEIYDLDFFDKTSVEGLSLDRFALPMAISLTIEHSKKISDVFSLARGLKIQDISDSDYDLFLTPKLTGFVQSSFVARFFSPRFPIFSLGFDQDKKISGDDPSNPDVIRNLSAEMEFTLDVSSQGQFSMFPYLKYTAIMGNQVDNLIGSGEHTESREILVGMRGLISYRQDFPKLELELVRSSLKSDDRGYNVNRAFLAANYTFLDQVLSRMGTDDYTKHEGSKQVQWMSGWFGELTLFPEYYVGLGASYKSSNSVDRRSQSGDDREENVTTNFSESHLALNLRPIEYLGLNARFYRTKIKPYSFYSFDSFQTEVDIKYPLVLMRSLPNHQQSFAYRTPTQLTVGYSWQNFKRPNDMDPTNDFLEKSKFNSYYASLKLFW